MSEEEVENTKPSHPINNMGLIFSTFPSHSLLYYSNFVSFEADPHEAPNSRKILPYYSYSYFSKGINLTLSNLIPNFSNSYFFQNLNFILPNLFLLLLSNLFLILQIQYKNSNMKCKTNFMFCCWESIFVYHLITKEKTQQLSHYIMSQLMVHDRL